MSEKETFEELVRAECFGGKKLGFFEKKRRLADSPQADAVYLIRLMQYHAACAEGKGLAAKLHRKKARRARRKLVRRYNIFVGDKTKIGKGLMLPHPTGIILGMKAEIGEKCKIFQGVTVGSRRNGEVKLGLQPHIGNNCTLFSGCAVIGGITLGDGVQVGANAVMNRDAEPGSVWAGVPARCLHKPE